MPKLNKHKAKRGKNVVFQNLNSMSSDDLRNEITARLRKEEDLVELLCSIIEEMKKK